MYKATIIKIINVKDFDEARHIIEDDPDICSIKVSNPWDGKSASDIEPEYVRMNSGRIEHRSWSNCE